MDLHDLIWLWKRRFVAASVLFTLLLSSLVMLAKHEQAARETMSVLNGLGGKVARLRSSTLEMKQSLASCRGLLPPDYEHKTLESQLFARVDDLKSLFPGAMLTISAPTEGANGGMIPFSATLAEESYSHFLNAFAAMQTRTFPFVEVKSVALSYDQTAKGNVAYRLEGVIVTPAVGKRGGP